MAPISGNSEGHLKPPVLGQVHVQLGRAMHGSELSSLSPGPRLDREVVSLQCCQAFSEGFPQRGGQNISRNDSLLGESTQLPQGQL